ncbi:hypothetical protein [Anthocerotibacter panamensis]|uniref:hypothetical protein n=1 Tax=Anthocerotibacter panamensis TaxID=2857077 RepID=UPI001C408266|nr:hypothetical protein [Anthocerotibacter panamensis]
MGDPTYVAFILYGAVFARDAQLPTNLGVDPIRQRLCRLDREPKAVEIVRIVIDLV